MLVIQDTLISEEIIEEQFHCNLTACKGACCHEGDYGAPVDAEEEKIIHKYDCTITGKSFKRTEKAERPDELMSIEAYYQLNADKDDRPAVIKKKLGLNPTSSSNSETSSN